MTSAQIKATLTFVFTLCGCGLLVFFMAQHEAQRTGQEIEIPVVHAEPIKVVVIPPASLPDSSKGTSADIAQPPPRAHTSDSSHPGDMPVTVLGSAKDLTRLDERNLAGGASDSRGPGDAASEPTRQTIEAWQPMESSTKPNDSVSANGERIWERRRLHLPESVIRQPGEPPILFFDWSVPLLRELVSRNLGCVIVRDPGASDPIGMLITSDTGWRFAPLVTKTPLAGVKLDLHAADHSSARELLDKAQWATGRTGLLLEFFPSASLWTTWLDQQQTALHKAQLARSQVAVTAGSVVWESEIPRYAVDEVAYLDGKRETIAFSRWPSNRGEHPHN